MAAITLDVELEGVTVGSRTASLIMGMHPEYVRHLIRHGWLKAYNSIARLRPAPVQVLDHDKGAGGLDGGKVV